MSKADEVKQPSKPGAPLGKLVAALVVLAAVAAVLLAAAVLPGRNDDKPPTDSPPVNVEVVTIVPKARVLDTFDLPGVVEPSRQKAVQVLLGVLWAYCGK